MPDIVLTTLNARYAHAAFGLRYLLANLGPLRERACIVEFDINQRSLDVLEVILARDPKIVGVGVYIWNAEPALKLVADLRRLRPDIIVVIGGPEVSHETDQQEICKLADYVITGEADLAFAELCEKLLTGERPDTRVIAAPLPSMDRLALPYDLYDAQDIAHRVIYVEASRGCPFKCEFCLSSLDVPVRNVPLEPFLEQMQSLLDRGVRQFKFVDRTFNLNLNFSKSILQFFADRYTPGLFLHFEMIPDRLPEQLRSLIASFPPGALQFEVGIQTFNDDVATRISRRQDNARLADNLKFLRSSTGVHVHADLIAGLPGETIDSFAVGFNRLIELGPQEIQVGILKRLRGTPIIRHDVMYGMRYSPHPPYEVLQTGAVDFLTMQRIRRFSRYWDMIANSGNFVRTLPMILEGPVPSEQSKPKGAFDSFLRLSDWLFARVGRQHAIALNRLSELVFEYLCELHPHAVVAEHLWDDFVRRGRPDVPEFLRPHLPENAYRAARRRDELNVAPSRQARHLA